MQPTLMSAARLVGPARWRGRLYLVEGYPGAVPSQDGRDCIVGELYELQPSPEELLARLDAYECVPDDYRRVRSRVETANGAVEAWVYVWNRPVQGLRRIESGDFQQFLNSP